MSSHGRKGCFLASVAALSLVSIISHHAAHRSLSTLVLHHSNPAARHVPSPSHHILRNRDHGTRVQVHDLFGNMPVRVKQRVAFFSTATNAGAKELETLKRQIVALLMAWPSAIYLKLIDMAVVKQELVVRGIQNPYPAASVFPRVPNSTMPERLDCKWICSILSQSGFIEPRDRGSWQETTASSRSVKVNALLCKNPAPSRRLQFLSLGVRPLNAESNGNILFEEINKLYAASGFGNLEEYNEQRKAANIKDRRFKRDGLTNRELRGGGKGIDRWPMFYMRIELQDPTFDLRMESEGALLKVFAVIKAMVLKFLESNGFRSAHRITKKSWQKDARPSLAKSISVAPDFFSGWSRIKSSRLTRASGQPKEIPSPPPPSPTQETTVPGTVALADDEAPVRIVDPGNENEDNWIEWIDPITKQKTMINSRTGMPIPMSTSRPQTAPPVLQRGTFSSPESPSFQPEVATDRPTSSSWAGTLLSSWQNPIFALVERPIPRIQNETNTDILPSRTTHARGTTYGFSASLTTVSRISRELLRSANVIAQVDKKFILIRTSSTPPSLIMIDQHAADERIRVESLLQDLRTQPSAKLDKPIVLPMASVHERDLLSQQAAFFAHWGIIYTLTSASHSPLTTATPTIPSSTIDFGTFTITALPSAISQRCILQPSLALNLIRSTIHSPLPHSKSTPPKALLDIINSRACRSAIMFNDELTLEECRELVRRLSQTGNPFQCAHGRGSMVVLVELGSSGTSSANAQKAKHGDDVGEIGFVDAWKAQQERDSRVLESG